MKLNITPGPWELTSDELGPSTIITKADVNGNIICEPPTWDISLESYGHNATAIVTAVNNTYHKGINPEAVPGMLEALKNYIQLIHDTIPFHEESIIYKQAVELLQKATL